MGKTAAAEWVARHAELVRVGGAVLDVAAGSGRNGRLFLERGHPVTFVDRTTTALKDLNGRTDARVVERDLEDGSAHPLRDATGSGSFAAVVVVNYLWRPLWPELCAAVAPGGLLLYDTFAVGHEVFGRPRRPDFLLRDNELLEVCAGWNVVEFAQGLVAPADGGPAVRQRICAVHP